MAKTRIRSMSRFGHWLADNLKPGKHTKLAQEAGISRQHLRRIAIGQAEPTRKVMRELALAATRLMRRRVLISDLFDIGEDDLAVLNRELVRISEDVSRIAFLQGMTVNVHTMDGKPFAIAAHAIRSYRRTEKFGTEVHLNSGDIVNVLETPKELEDSLRFHVL